MDPVKRIKLDSLLFPNTSYSVPATAHVERLMAATTHSYGYILVLLAQIPALIVHTLAKILQLGQAGDNPVTTIQIITCRMILTLIPGVLILYYKSVPNMFLGDPKARKLLAFRTVAGVVGVCGFYGTEQHFSTFYSLCRMNRIVDSTALASMIYLTLAEATVLTFLSPLCAALLGSMIDGAKLSRKDISVASACFAGVLIIILPKILREQSDTMTEQGVEHHLKESVLGALIALLGVAGSTVR